MICQKPCSKSTLYLGGGGVEKQKMLKVGKGLQLFWQALYYFKSLRVESFIIFFIFFSIVVYFEK